MKNLILYTLLALCFYSSFFRASNHITEEENNFIHRYSLSETDPTEQSLKTKLDELFNNPDFFQAFITRDAQKLKELGCYIYTTDWHNIVAEHPAIPGWIIKGPKWAIIDWSRNYKRVQHGQIMRAAAQEYPEIIVPQEYLYHYPQAPDDLSNDNYCVISKKLPLSPQHLSTLTPEQINRIEDFMRKIKFWDRTIENNICITKDNKIAFIDTEPFVDFHPLFQKILDFFYFENSPRATVSIRHLREYIYGTPATTMNKYKLMLIIAGLITTGVLVHKHLNKTAAVAAA